MDTLMLWWKQVLDYMAQGGFVMWPLALSAAVLWYALGYRALLLGRGGPRSMRTQFDGKSSPFGGIIGHAFAVGSEAAQKARALGCSPAALRKRLDEAFAPLEQTLGSGALIIKLVVILAPLAGLLGTVSGMIETFDALGDMTLFRKSGGIAGGISQALISTQMGLAVAIPGLLVGQLLQRRETRLQDQIAQLKELLCARHRDFCGAHLSPPAPTPSTGHQEKDKTMRFARKKRNTDAQVDISPLIDMVFILLIFFMVSTTFVKDMKIELERPAANSASRASTKALRVHLDRAGAIYLDGMQVKAWMLQSRVRQVLKDDPSRPILVITDRLVQAEKLIEVVDQCRLAGAKDVGVATRREA